MLRWSPLFLLALATNSPAADTDDPQVEAERAEWKWSDERATVLDSMLRASCDYRIELLRKKKAWGELTIRFADKDGVALTIAGHAGTSFVTDGTIVYYADYHPISTGCSLIAYDLMAKKQLWKTALKGLGPIDHTKYRNRVLVERMPGGALRVWGWESAGKYLELVDPKKGKTVAHRLFAEGK